jgi:NAD(P)-dependent dehydrogenase (short-subunit alcohol dehydrogenase family)
MKSVLITGTSTGIGHATAARLRADGWRVFAGQRGAVGASGPDVDSDLDPGETIPVELDVTDADQIAAAAALIAERADGRLDAVVHNAGIAVGGALEELDPEQLRASFDVNVVGAIAVSQALLPMLRVAGGRIVIVGSVGGKVAFPFAGPYHASKYALEALADSLRAELKPQGVGVAIVEPAVIDTPIWAKARAQVEEQRRGLDATGRKLYDERLESFQESLSSAERKGEPPAKVADKIAAAIVGEGARYPVGRGAGTLTRLRPLLPEFVFDRLAALAG